MTGWEEGLLDSVKRKMEEKAKEREKGNSAV